MLRGCITIDISWVVIQKFQPPTTSIKRTQKYYWKRISIISSSQIFSKIIYKDSLKKSGFQNKLTYQQNLQNNDEYQEKKKRKRNVIWYNPPYSINVKTNIGKVFFKHYTSIFQRRVSFYKIFNKNTVKLSYSGMHDMASIIASHSKKIIRPNIQDYGCNCRKKKECAM